MKKIKLFLLSLIVLAALIFAYFITYTFVEPKAYDYMVKHVLTEKLPFDTHKQTYGSDDVILIVIDDKSIGTYRWPWKRDLYCKIYSYLKDYAHPDVILHDALVSNLDIDNPDSDTRFFNSVN